MADQPVVTAAELERMSPNERAQLLRDRSTEDLSDLEPGFRAKVETDGRRMLEDRGLLDAEHR